ncbi:protein yellow [Biomphalaria pfeifferi]|uniref:Protein yellow n=1 Tax=Biomphalaria pfeifferi TaxID=112525 RepID=A0AAD8BDR1_BIOPF|nr:protein yellow [Biomphalaria pfeifferi]
MYRYSHLYVVGVVLLGVVNSEVIFEAVKLDWVWDNPGMKDQYIASGDYDPLFCHISGVQYDGFSGDVFVTVPRLKAAKGVPAGLNIISPNNLLEPFPNFEANKLGDCKALQLPMSMAVDPRKNLLYVIDVGRVGVTTDHPSNLCPPKLVVYTTLRGDMVRSHELPDSVVPHTSSFLNDLVLDYVDPEQTEGAKYVYISDTIGEQLVVFDLTSNETWSYKHSSMRFDNDSNINIIGVNYSWPYGINGIAMSPSFNYVYYSALGSKKLWQIPTWVLRKNDSDFSSYVRYVGDKVSNSDAMVFGKRSLYYGALSKDAVYKWNAEKDLIDQGVTEGEVRAVTQVPIIQNWETIQWPDGIALGSRYSDENRLYFVSARAQLFHSNALDFSGAHGANFRVFKVSVDEESYLAESDKDKLPVAVVVG